MVVAVSGNALRCVFRGAVRESVVWVHGNALRCVFRCSAGECRLSGDALRCVFRCCAGNCRLNGDALRCWMFRCVWHDAEKCRLNRDASRCVVYDAETCRLSRDALRCVPVYKYMYGKLSFVPRTMLSPASHAVPKVACEKKKIYTYISV